MNLKVTVVVSPELTKTLERFRHAPEQLGKALYVEAPPIMDEAIRRAPRDSGALDGSAYIVPPVDPRHPVVELGFAAEWAAYQHERLDLQHPGGGEPKFLQRALDAGRDQLLQRVGARIARFVEAGATVDASPRYPASPPASPQHSRTARARAALRGR